MRFLRFLPLAAAAVLLPSCATLTQPKTPPVLAKLEAMGIDSRTYVKIENRRVLSYDDIYGLVKKGVPGPVILTYVRSTKAPYTLTNTQLQNLVNAGASADLVNYLGKSTGFFEATQRGQTGGEAKWRREKAYFDDPYFFGPGPFGWPDEWYDPAFVDAMF